MKKSKSTSLGRLFSGLLLSAFLVIGCEPPVSGDVGENKTLTLKQRINNAKSGETIDLGKEEISITEGDSYTVDKSLTIVNGAAKNATFIVTADGVLFKNVADVERIIAGEELGDGDLAIRNCYEIDYLHVNGGGKNSIHIASTEIGELKVSKKDVRIVLETDEEGEKTAKVNTAIIEKDCKLEGAEGLSFGTVQVEDPEVEIDTENVAISDYKLKLAEGMYVNTQNCDCGVETQYEVLEDGTAKFWITKEHSKKEYTWHSQMSLNHEFDTAGNYKISFTAKADSALNTNVDLWCQSKEVTTCSTPLELTSEYKTFTFVVPVHKELIGTSNVNINMSTTAIYLKDLKVEKVEDSSWTLYQSDEILNVKEDDLTSVGHMAILESSDSSVKIYRNARAMKTPAVDSQYFVYTPKITTAGNYKFVFTDSSYTHDDVNRSKSVFDTLLIRYKDGTEKEKFTGFTDSKGTYFAKFTVSDEDLEKGIEFVFQSALNWQWITQYFILNDVAVKSADESVEGTELTSGSNTGDSNDNNSTVWVGHSSECTCGGTFSYEELSDNEYKISTTGDHTSAVWNSQFGIDNQITTPGKYRITFEAKAEKETKTTVEVWSGTTNRTFASSPVDLGTTYNTYSMLVYIGEPVVGQIRTKIDIVNGTYYLKNVKIEENNTKWSAWMDNSLYTPEADDQWNLPNLALVLGDEVDGEISTVAAVTKNGNWTNVDGWKRNFSYQMPAFEAGDYVASFTKNALLDDIYVKSNTSGTNIIVTKMNREAGDYYLKFTIPEDLSGENFELGFSLYGSSQWTYDMFTIENFRLKKASEDDNLSGKEVVNNYVLSERKKISDNLEIYYHYTSKDYTTIIEETEKGFSFKANTKLNKETWNGVTYFTYHDNYDFLPENNYKISLTVTGPTGKVSIGTSYEQKECEIEADKENQLEVIISSNYISDSVWLYFYDNEIGTYTVSDIKVEHIDDITPDVYELDFNNMTSGDEEFDLETNIITFSQAWGVKGWWFDSVDFTDWNKVVIEYESEVSDVQVVIEYVDVEDSDSTRVIGQDGKIEAELNPDYKSVVKHLYLQTSEPGTIKLLKAYLSK